MEQVEFNRLLRLTEDGDKDAAQSLYTEAQRRGDLPMVQKAADLLGKRRAGARRYNLQRTATAKKQELYTNLLNEQQRAVVLAGAGPLLVIAGAGSGKTRTLTYRVAHLIERGVSPERILLLTFTNKAAREMTRRVDELVEGKASQIWGGTFHHVGHRILRRHAPLLGYPETFGIMDGEDVATLMGVCVADLKLDAKKQRFPKGAVIHRYFSKAVNTLRPLEEVILEDGTQFANLIEPIQAVCARYIRRKFEMGLMDYDDLLINWRRLFSEHPEIGERFAQQFEHVLVDEYQDTNHLQGELVDLCARTHRNVMVVGDDSQSIYSFRGANFENILRFPARYEGCTVFKLEKNYRSTPEILNLANASIRFNSRRFDKALVTERPHGMKPALVPCRDMEQQAQFIAERILELHETGVSLRDIAVLYRAHYQSMQVQLELNRHNIPFTLRSGLRFFEQAHIKDVVAHLRFVANPRDELSFTRIIKLCEGIGDRLAQRLWEELGKHDDPLVVLFKSDLAAMLPKQAQRGFARLIELLQVLNDESLRSEPGTLVGKIIDSDYSDYLQTTFRNADNRVGDLEQLSAFAAQYNSLDAFLEELALVAGFSGEDIGEAGQKDEYIVLSTVHQAKGLEWPVVFVSSLWDGGFPTAQGQRDTDSEEEERRLFYVAMTRAKDELYLSYPLSRRDREGWHNVQRPSLFITELKHSIEPREDDLMEVWAIDEDVEAW